MTVGNWLTIAGMGLGLFLAIYSFIYSMDKRLSKLENRCDTHQAVIDSIATLNSRLDKIAADNETFWRILGPKLAGIIHSPKAKVRDELVDKLMADDITSDECRMLIGLLREAIDSDRWDGNKRLAGAWILARACTKLSDISDEDVESCA